MDATAETELVPKGRDVMHVDELAVKLGVSPDAVRDAITRGEINASRLGRRLLIPLPEVRRLLSPAGNVAV